MLRKTGYHYYNNIILEDLLHFSNVKEFCKYLHEWDHVESIIDKCLHILSLIDCVYSLIVFMSDLVGVPVDEQYDFINRGLFILYTILACAGIVFAVLCLIFNLIFKDRKWVNVIIIYSLHNHFEKLLCLYNYQFILSQRMSVSQHWLVYCINW